MPTSTQLTWARVTIVETPRRSAAKKTLINLLSKDLELKSQNRLLKRLRKKHYAPKRRGGRMYGGHVSKICLLKGERGEAATIQLTPEVARELESVQQYVRLSEFPSDDRPMRRVPIKKQKTSLKTKASTSHSLLTAANQTVQSVVPSKVEPASRADSDPEYFIRTGADGSVQLSSTPFSTRRYKVRFADADTMFAAMQEGADAVRVPTLHPKRYFFSVESRTPADLASDAATDRFLNHISSRYKANISNEVQFAVDREPQDSTEEKPRDRFDVLISKANAHQSLAEIMTHIGAAEAWAQSEGENTTIAIVDTGVSGLHPEFDHSRRVGQWSLPGIDPWQDVVGHGTMVACIAAANGEFLKGVAPKANLISCRTDYYDGELTLIYDYLASLAESGNKSIGRLIANNSFGYFIDKPPTEAEENSLEFPAALSDAIKAGVICVFSAGNKHRNDPSHCAPNSIWSAHKSRADILTVGNARFTKEIWPTSSRGPGQHYGKDWASRKPDVLGVTPRCGWILRGNQMTASARWGTSGAAAQASGLCSMILSKNSTLACDDVFKIIRKTATDLNLHENCQGDGKINCAAAVREASVVSLIGRSEC